MNFGKKNLQNLKKTDGGTQLGRKISYSALRVTFISLVLVITLGICAGVGALHGLIATAPDISNMSVTPSESATYIYNSDGTVLQKLSLATSNRTPNIL